MYRKLELTISGHQPIDTFIFARTESTLPGLLVTKLFEIPSHSRVPRWTTLHTESYLATMRRLLRCMLSFEWKVGATAILKRASGDPGVGCHCCDPIEG